MISSGGVLEAERKVSVLLKVSQVIKYVDFCGWQIGFGAFFLANFF